DAWRPDAAPSTAAILEIVEANAATARSSIQHLVKNLPRRRSASPADTALDGAIATPRGQWDPATRVRLDAVARRILRQTPGG
ncbi:MAG: S-methyl-5'-thioadenosine phosphorylase, partial [Croceibacterium sp.]